MSDCISLLSVNSDKLYIGFNFYVGDSPASFSKFQNSPVCVGSTKFYEIEDTENKICETKSNNIITS